MKMKFLTCLLFLATIIGLACSSQNAPTKNDSHSGMNHNAANEAPNRNAPDHQNMDHSGVNHSEMKSSPNAANAPYDLQFLDTMIAHHQGAIDMAKMTETKAERTELKTLAKNIIAAQEKEISDMRSWREKSFGGKEPAVNMEMAGMNDSMKGMDMKKLESLSSKAFDIEFIDQMIPHHEGAVVMAKQALQKSQDERIKSLATAVIKDQEAEIKQMTEWKAVWSK